MHLGYGRRERHYILRSGLRFVFSSDDKGFRSFAAFIVRKSWPARPQEHLVASAESAGFSAASHSVSAASPIPVLRPSLPGTRDLLPYLEVIDREKWYSNYGPLVSHFESRLSGYLGCSQAAVTTASSGTSALTATLLALQLPRESKCLMPSWTFAATPHAARAAGLTPFFHDVDPRTWALDPNQVLDTIERGQRSISVVLAVSPFGSRIDINGWQKFGSETGIPVVIDAAAGFDTVRATPIPAIVSLHATKVFGAGEGGFVATNEFSLLERIKTCSNFGFSGSRNALLPAVNSKMSEYHAAVALANLDVWPETRRQHLHITEQYRQRIERLEGVTLQPGYGTGWVSSTTNVMLPPNGAISVARRLLTTGIETRSWWGQGCHMQAAFQDCPRMALPVTEDLASRVLGLPHFAGMREEDVDRVAEELFRALQRRRS